MGLFSSKPEITVVIPAYNEEGAIVPTIKGVGAAITAAGLKHEIITVDDGSTDGTAAAAEAAGCRVIRHPVNRGYGRSLLSGIHAASHDWILIIDADGSYPPEEIGKLLPHIPAFDMVVGAREGSLFWGNPVKALMRFIYLNIARFVAGEAIPDANSGLRIFRKEAVTSSMPVVCYGYSFTTTMTLSFLNAGRFVRFEPIRFTERVGQSKVKPVRDILRTLQIMTQVIIYYNPLKLFATLSFLVLGAFALSMFLPPLAWLVSAFYAALLIFVAGLILESIRLGRKKG
ncbi:MAG: glycosyltransferase family 2 protein [Elusimicrobiales bacterium]|nr:glycosyltransferase family 2 protein [Elusimicrobiales bacterium]